MSLIISILLFVCLTQQEHLFFYLWVPSVCFHWVFYLKDIFNISVTSNLALHWRTIFVWMDKSQFHGYLLHKIKKRISQKQIVKYDPTLKFPFFVSALLSSHNISFTVICTDETLLQTNYFKWNEILPFTPPLQNQSFYQEFCDITSFSTILC